MDTHQRTKCYIRETKIQQVRDLKPVVNMEVKLDHMLKLQVKLVAVSIKKVLWAKITCRDSMSMSKLNQLINFKARDHKFQKLDQEFPRRKAKSNLKFQQSHSKIRN
jgi:hypothetical protein